MEMNARRGFVPEDTENFGEAALPVLRRASRQISWLLEEGYDAKSASVFVGNHFLLSERQRLAIVRSIGIKAELLMRRDSQRALSELSGQKVWVDGFNEIITLEVLLSRSPLFRGMDGCIRDLASLRGTYRLIPETDGAILLLLTALQQAGAEKAVILLDEPVSNSGRLKTRIAELGEKIPMDLDILIFRGVDRALWDKDFVITSDSVILDHCKSWVNLTEKIAVWEQAKVLQVW